jgi:DNA-directed RNA polymerase subunit omega
MARTTITDTLPYVSSKYELGMLGSQRVRDLNGGADPVVLPDNDKMTVVALREIASGKLDMDQLRTEFVQSYKDAPDVSDDETLETKSENPLLREIDAELESALSAEGELPAGALSVNAAESADAAEETGEAEETDAAAELESVHESADAPDAE